MHLKTALGIAVGLSTVAYLLAAPASAEREAPPSSPVARISQQIGTAEVAVEYSSPAVQGRRIWGGIVAYGQPWEISATHPTTLHFSEDVRVGGTPVAAGTYRLFSVPGKTSWTIVLSPYLAAAGQETAPVIEAARLKLPVKAAPFRERLAFLFSNFDDERTSLDLEWEKVRVSLSIETRSAERVVGEMKRLDDIWRSYANAARFMLESEKDFDAGLKYADLSLALKQDWYTYWIKAALLAAKHEYRDAIEQGHRAADLGRLQLGDGFVLQHELERTLAAWQRMPAAVNSSARRAK
jgi:hypothetical protein